MGEFLFYLQVSFFITMHIVEVYSFQLKIGYVILTQLKGLHQLHLFMFLLLEVCFPICFSILFALGTFSFFNWLASNFQCCTTNN